MKPIQLSGHERPITSIRINRDGDLLFSTGKDFKAMAWYMSNGERLGTYDGHKGAVNDFDCDFDSNYGITGAADCNLGVWKVTTGENIRMLNPRGRDRVTAVRWACGDRQFCVCTFGQRKAHVLVYDFDAEMFNDRDGVPDEDIVPVIQFPAEPEDEHAIFTGHTAKVTEVLWGPINTAIVTGSEDGTLRRWYLDTLTDPLVISFNPTQKVAITSLEYSRDKTLLIASGRDMTARLFEGETLQQLKIFRSDKPLNCASLHPRLNLVVLAGGQAARDVTTTASSKGKFEVQFFHTIFEEKVGEIRTGHFSPINCLVISSDGNHFVTGAEEGNCRIFKFDADFENKFLALERSFIEMNPL